LINNLHILEDPRQLITPFSPRIYNLAWSLGSAEEAFYFVRDTIKYVRDPNEVWRTAERTLDLGVGDCDDQAILLCSLFRALGEPSKVLIIELPMGGHATVELRPGEIRDPTIKHMRFDQNVEYFNARLIADFNEAELNIYDELTYRSIIVAQPTFYGALEKPDLG